MTELTRHRSVEKVLIERLLRVHNPLVALRDGIVAASRLHHRRYAQLLGSLRGAPALLLLRFVVRVVVISRHAIAVAIVTGAGNGASTGSLVAAAPGAASAAFGAADTATGTAYTAGASGRSATNAGVSRGDGESDYTVIHAGLGPPNCRYSALPPRSKIATR